MKFHVRHAQINAMHQKVLLSMLLLASLLLIAAGAPFPRLHPSVQLAPLTLAPASTALIPASAAPPPARVITLSYDGAGRITTADYSGVTLQYHYDATGNLITQTYRASIYLPVVTR